MPWIMTANLLISGEAVFLTETGWDTSVNNALVAADSDRLQGLEARAKADTDAAIVVEAYAIEVTASNGGIVPVRLREQMRTSGPSVRPDLGRQAAI